MRQLLAEAAAVGLLESGEEPDETAGADALRRLLNWSPGQRDDPTPDETLMRRFQTEYEDLTARYAQVEAERGACARFESHREGFQGEVVEQEDASVGLFPPDPGGNGSCPLCDRPLEAMVPAVEEIQSSLAELAKQLEGANHLRPRLKTYLEERESERSRLRAERADTRRRIDDLLAQQDALRGAAALDDRRSRTLGRISVVLEGLGAPEQREDLEQDLSAVSARIDALRAELSTDELQARLDSTTPIESASKCPDGRRN